MQTRHRVEVNTKTPEGIRGGTMAWTDQGLGAAIALGVREGTYYLAVGYAVQVQITETCAICDGLGKIKNHRYKTVYREKTCPECKGKNSNGTPLEFQMHAHPNVKMIPVNGAGETIL